MASHQQEVNEAPKLRAEVERLREALVFYADYDSWHSGLDDDRGNFTLVSPVEMDEGERARVALNPQEATDGQR